MHPVKILLRAVYDPEFTRLKDLRVVITHRGALNDEKVIPGSKIIKVEKSGFYYKEKDEEVFIPGHRIKRIVGA